MQIPERKVTSWPFPEGQSTQGVAHPDDLTRKIRENCFNLLQRLFSFATYIVRSHV